MQGHREGPEELSDAGTAGETSYLMSPSALLASSPGEQMRATTKKALTYDQQARRVAPRSGFRVQGCKYAQSIDD